MSDSDNIKQDVVPNHHDDPAAHATESQGMVDYVKDQLSSTGTSLADLGSKAGSIAGESANDVKNKVGSVSPGDVYNNIRGRVQSTESGDNGNHEGGEQENTSMLILKLKPLINMESRLLTARFR